MTDFAQMIHGGLHLNNQLEDLFGLTCFFHVMYSGLADLRRWIIQLGEQKTQRPGTCVRQAED